MTNILVTGGLGFIGSEFVRQESKKRAFRRIYVLDSCTYAANLNALDSVLCNENIELIQGDISDMNLVDEVIHEVDFVVNFAAESHVDNSILNFDPFLKSNIIGVANLLRSASQKKTIRFVQISTDEVYGSIEEGSFIETDSLNPRNPYSASKASAEFLCNAFRNTYGLDVVVTRTCNNYGPYQQFEKFIPTAIKALLEGRKIPLYGDGSQIREWIHVSDNCRAISDLVFRGETGAVYNIGTGRDIRNLDLALLIIANLGLDESFIEFVEDRPGHDQRYSISSRKIQSKIGWFPLVTFEEGIRETVSWYREKLGGF